jgi:hypothetical protein
MIYNFGGNKSEAHAPAAIVNSVVFPLKLAHFAPQFMVYDSSNAP